MARQSKYQKDHTLLRQSGMFWEFHPELSGEWEKDKEAFIAFCKKREKRSRKDSEDIITIS
jgi:hypothetical protein